MAGETVADPSGPLSWRDVYRAVEKSEASIVAAIDAAVRPLTDRQNDHELRLRALEQHNQREQGVFTTLGVGKTFILAMAAVVGPILSIIALVSQ
jgi:hypothetical protein